MLKPTGLKYSRERVHRPDGSFYDVVEVTVQGTDRVEFHKGINEPRERKLADVAHLRILKALARGVDQPVIVVWDAYSHTDFFAEFTVSKSRSGIVHVSKNAAITHYLRNLLRSQNYVIDRGILRVKECHSADDNATQIILDKLYAEQRIRVVQSDPAISMQDVYNNLDPYRDLIAVGKLGFPSTYAWQAGYPIVFNTSYFLFEEEDFISDFSLFGDGYNLQIRDGVIESPPLHERSTLLFGFDGQASLRSLSLQDLRLTFLDRDWDLAQFSVYTRYSDVLMHGRTMTETPLQTENIDFIIIDRAVVGYKLGGQTEIPHNGFVVSLPMALIPPGVLSNEVSYSFRNGESYRAAIQCGPGLIKAGQIILNGSTLLNEQFFRKKYENQQIVDYGVVPTDYAEDIDHTRAARAAVGVDIHGNFKILVVESVNQGMAEPSGESSGVTLQELALLAKDRKYHYALNLDGGGSATIHYLYGQLVRGADRRGLPGVMYERMVPNVGVILS